MRMRMNTGLAVVAGLQTGIIGGFASLCANAETVKEVRAVIASNSVNRIPRHNISRYYNAWFVDNCTVAEREAILERNIAAHRRWMEIAPKDTYAAQADLGGVLATVGRWKEAKTELAAALAAGDFERARVNRRNLRGEDCGGIRGHDLGEGPEVARRLQRHIPAHAAEHGEYGSCGN